MPYIATATMDFGNLLNEKLILYLNDLLRLLIQIIIGIWVTNPINRLNLRSNYLWHADVSRYIIKNLLK